ncbi:nucleoside diphosphate kinase [Melampsora americana]|nr:nucleoside diphosphate kinase [Melampsora americana]
MASRNLLNRSLRTSSNPIQRVPRLNQLTTATFTTRCNSQSNRNLNWIIGGVGATLLAGSIVMNPFQEPFKLEAVKTIAGVKGTVTERSFIMLKPDGTARQLLGKVINRMEERGYKLVAIKSLVPSKKLASDHYSDLSSRKFFPSLVEYITCGVPVVAMVWEGQDVIRQGRRIVGATNPLEAEAGTIRGQYCISVGRNIIHASDSFESATHEIGMWFKENELSEYKTANHDWVFANVSFRILV